MVLILHLYQNHLDSKRYGLRTGVVRTVEVVWRDHTPYDAEVQVMRKVERCGKKLTQWSRKNFKNVRRELLEKKKIAGKGRTDSDIIREQFSG